MSLVIQIFKIKREVNIYHSEAFNYFILEPFRKKGNPQKRKKILDNNTLFLRVKNTTQLPGRKPSPAILYTICGSLDFSKAFDYVDRSYDAMMRSNVRANM